MTDTPSAAGTHPGVPSGRWLILFGAMALPVSLFWDFSWESTVGVDRFWAPPHVLTYLAMLMTLAGALLSVRRADASAAAAGELRLGRWTAPAGIWLVLWGGGAFATAVLGDRWWQAAYGLGAGIWHPPQILKATAFFVTLLGAWPAGATRIGGAAPATTSFSPLVGAALLALIGVVTVTRSLANQQHSATFHQLAAATYPVVLAALVRGGSGRWPATTAAVIYLLMVGGLVWLLPLVPAHPLTGPVYQPMDRLLPPPFPLLLVVPAFAMEFLRCRIRWPAGRGADWLQAAGLGGAFFLVFLIVQWVFAGFLLTPAADHWFFAGGGRHWPFFLRISPAARTAFWEGGADVMNGTATLRALALAVVAARLGLWLGAGRGRTAR